MPSYHAAIGCIAERSSFNAGLILARTLRARGHRVTFVGSALEEFRRHVQRHGYAFASLESPAYVQLSAAAAHAKPLVAALRAWRVAQRQLLSDLERLADDIRPDLAFLDVLAADPAASLLSARRTPTIIFHGGMLSARFSSRHPPIWSSLAPPGHATPPLQWRVRCLAAWAWARCARRRRLMKASRPWVSEVMQGYGSRQVRRLARRHGWRFCWGDWGPMPALPEIVLNHRAFDWPQLRTSNRCYLSGGRATRQEFDSAWAVGLDAAKPLVYGATSTMIGYGDVFEIGGGCVVRAAARPMKHFLDATVGAVASRPEWQLLLACGPFAHAFPADALPSNVRVVERAPSTEVLQRAAVMITQAGAGAVREAVAFGVPMLAFPLWTDQFGNTARIVYHGVGERLQYPGTSGAMAAAIARALEPRVREAAARLARECARDAEGEGERFVEFVGRHTGLAI